MLLNAVKKALTVEEKDSVFNIFSHIAKTILCDVQITLKNKALPLIPYFRPPKIADIVMV